jgi:hypothetical protein
VTRDALILEILFKNGGVLICGGKAPSSLRFAGALHIRHWPVENPSPITTSVFSSINDGANWPIKLLKMQFSKLPACGDF